MKTYTITITERQALHLSIACRDYQSDLFDKGYLASYDSITELMEPVLNQLDEITD